MCGQAPKKPVVADPPPPRGSWQRPLPINNVPRYHGPIHPSDDQIEVFAGMAPRDFDAISDGWHPRGIRGSGPPAEDGPDKEKYDNLIKQLEDMANDLGYGGGAATAGGLDRAVPLDMELDSPLGDNSFITELESKHGIKHELATSIFNEAKERLAKKGTSGGVAMMTAAVGLSELEVTPADFAPGRVVVLHCGGLCAGGFLWIGVYLHHSIGLAAANWSILCNIRNVVKEFNMPFVIQGDWNIVPEILRGSKWVDSLDAVILAPQDWQQRWQQFQEAAPRTDVPVHGMWASFIGLVEQQFLDIYQIDPRQVLSELATWVAKVGPSMVAIDSIHVSQRREAHSEAHGEPSEIHRAQTELSGLSPEECAAVAREVEAVAPDVAVASKAPFAPMRLAATMDRAMRICFALQAKLEEAYAGVPALGKALGIDEHACSVFVEAELRASVLFQVSKLAQLALQQAKALAGLPLWTAISRYACSALLFPAATAGVVVFCEEASGDEEAGVPYGYSAPFAEQFSGNHAEKAPFRPGMRRRLNGTAVCISVLAPWLLFTVVLGLLSFPVHYNNPGAVYLAVVLCFAAVAWVAFYAYIHRTTRSHSPEHEPSWLFFLTLSLALAWMLGIAMGYLNYITNTLPYQQMTHLNSYSDVDPGLMRGAQLMDAGSVMFAEGSMLDLNKSMGFKNQEVYCVAPIVKGSGERATYDFWAIGIDCCSG
ncbi:unnamed protein product, partial [Prorocentrum cordatum]